MSETGMIRDASVIAAEINGIKEQVRSSVLSGAVEIGKRLKEAKSMVPYGSWGEWLESNVQYSTRTAQNLMAVAEEYGRKETQALADLTYTQAVLLLGVPAEDREAFVAEHPVEEMSTRELKEQIEALKAENAKRQVTIEELMAKAEEQEELAGEAEDARAQKERADAAEEAAREKADEVSRLMKLLDKERRAAQQAGEARHEDQEEAQRAREEALRGDLDRAREEAQAAREEAQRLRKEIEEAGKPVIQQVEVVPEDIKAELEQLRGTAGSGKAIGQFRTAFESMRASLDQMSDALACMDEATAAQYRAASLKALDIAKGKMTGTEERA